MFHSARPWEDERNISATITDDRVYVSKLAFTLVASVTTELALSDIPLLNGETGGPEDMADTEDPFLFRASGELVTFRTVFGWS